MPARRRALLALPVLALLLAGAALVLRAAPADAAIVWAVGDGGVVETTDDRVADRLQAEGPFQHLLYLGDVYETGTAQEFRDNFAPSFGRFRSIGHPTPGNHEWDNRAEGYDPFWGSRAPRNSGGHYYSFEVAGWHIISLNSEEDASAGSPQADWLRRDLATYTGSCTLPFIHRPRSSAGTYGNTTRFDALWKLLAGRAPAILSGHEHNYQRFKPDEHGIRQFIVGTGGRPLYGVNEADPRLEASDDETFGALRLELQPGRADFQFVALDGRRLDSGTLTCTPNQEVVAPAPPAVVPPPQPVASVTPAVRLAAPREGARHTRRLRVLRGTAAVPAGAQVGVVLTRRTGRTCRAYDGRAFRASCRRAPLVAVQGTSSWRLRLAGAPLPGRYRAVAVVSSPRGVLAKDGSTFRVR
jgi:acid phosphatase type 7